MKENSSHPNDYPFLFIMNLKRGGLVGWREFSGIQMQVSLHSKDCTETNICLNLKNHLSLRENNHASLSFPSGSLQIDQYLC